MDIRSSLVFIALLGFSYEALYTPSSFNVSLFGSGMEGACVDAQGNLYAVDFMNDAGSIGKIVFFSNGSSSSELFFHQDGALFNGIRFDVAGNMYLADVAGNKVVKVVLPSKAASTYCSVPGFYGVPNDLEIAANGIIYLSGQNYSADAGQVWRCNTDGTSTLLDTMNRTNGITLSPNDSILYVSEADLTGYTPNFNLIWQYDLSTTGAVSNKRLLVNFTTGSVDVDGMRTDIAGNLYVTRNGGGQVVKVSPSGQILQTILLPTGFNGPTNLDFGGADGKTVYVVGITGYLGAAQGASFLVDEPGRDFVYLHPNSGTSGVQGSVTTGVAVAGTTGIGALGTTSTSGSVCFVYSLVLFVMMFFTSF